MTYRAWATLLLWGALTTQRALAQDWYEIERLPLLRPLEHVDHAASYDRSGGNLDLATDLGFDEHGDRILLEREGAGCVDRIWFATIVTLGETLRVYFEGEAKPRINQPFWSLFSGRDPRFPAPLVGDIRSSSGGYVSYVPLCHHKSIRVTLSSGILPRYHNVDHHSVTTGALPNRFDPQSAPSEAARAWRTIGVTKVDGLEQQATFDLSLGESRTLLDASGSGWLSSLELKLPGVLPQRNKDGTTSPNARAVDILNGLRVQMYWDGELSPSVDAPVGALFAIGDFGPGAVGGLLAGQTATGTLYFKLPMPYREHARIVLLNGSGTALKAMHARIVNRPLPARTPPFGKLTTVHRTVTAEPGKDLTLLDVQGSGHVVGVVFSERGVGESRQYLEGDERIFIDGLRSPTIHGTGTEDFFNGAWYYNRGIFALPTHGARAHLKPGSSPGVDKDATAQFRFLLGDAIPFRSAIRLHMEHGPGNDEAITGSTLVYYYRADTVLTLSDTLQVGHAASEQAHEYQLANGTWSGTRSGTFHGRDDGLRVTSTGRAHRGVSSFRLAVDPKHHAVLLRRLFDQSVGKQRAEIWVDGRRAGIWYTPDQNHTHVLREEDFPLPPALTKGKSRLYIQVRFIDSPQDWSELQYQSLSIIP